MSCTGWVISLERSPWSFKCPTLVTVSGRSRCTTRTDKINDLELQYGTKPGFYIVVGPNWEGTSPAGIVGVVRSSTD